MSEAYEKGKTLFKNMGNKAFLMPNPYDYRTQKQEHEDWSEGLLSVIKSRLPTIPQAKETP